MISVRSQLLKLFFLIYGSKITSISIVNLMKVVLSYYKNDNKESTMFYASKLICMQIRKD